MSLAAAPRVQHRDPPSRVTKIFPSDRREDRWTKRMPSKIKNVCLRERQLPEECGDWMREFATPHHCYVESLDETNALIQSKSLLLAMHSEWPCAHLRVSLPLQFWPITPSHAFSKPSGMMTALELSCEATIGESVKPVAWRSERIIDNMILYELMNARMILKDARWNPFNLPSAILFPMRMIRLGPTRRM